MIVIAPSADERFAALILNHDVKGLAIRLAVAGRGQGGFQYQLELVRAEDRNPADPVVQGNGYSVIVDVDSVEYLDGARVEYVEENGGGFRVDNPNPIWKDPIAAAVQRILDEEINPAVASHGGFITLLDVRDGVAYIQMGGGCQGCGMADVTLKQGVEVRIRAAIPEIQRVADTTDHAGGSNPFYRPAKGSAPVTLE